MYVIMLQCFEMDGAVVIERFNSSDHHCTYCKGPLEYPIKTINDVGTFCEKCFDKSVPACDSESLNLEFVMVNLLMPCKYSFRGCNKTGTSSVITVHEKICMHRDKICPLYDLQKCTVCDHISDLVLHFSEHHPSQIQVSDGNSIELTYELSDESINEFWMLIFEEEKILLNVKLRNDKLLFLNYDIDNAEDLQSLTCKIQHRNSDVYSNEKICKLLRNEDLGNVEFEENAIWFSKAILENYFGLTLNTVITLERDTAHISNDEILSRLECPVCSNFMRKNIKLCAVGHSVCNDCESKLDKCPICTLPFCGARNFALEGISDLLKILASNEKIECPLKKDLHCQWRGNDTSIIEHLKDLHSDRITINKNLKRVLEYTTEFLETNYLVTYGQVFKVVCRKEKYDDVMAVIIELVGHDEDSQKYYYNICFNSLYKQSIIWYTKSRVFARRRVEFYVDYLAIGRILCNNQFDISYTITKNNN